MGSLTPVQIALLIIGFLAAIGVIITFVRTQMTYSGYGEVSGEVRRLGRALHGEVFRDGGDVVVSGTWDKQTVVVRFSNEENTPGLNIRMPAPATFQLSVSPAGGQVTEGGRVVARTTDDMFDARFTTRTDQPTQAHMFLTRTTTGLLQRLACSQNTYLSVGRGEIELSELVIPPLDPAEHVIDHLKAMSALSTSLRSMPGAEKVKVAHIEREHHVAARIAMVIGASVALGSIFAATRVPQRPASGANETFASGILPADASLIREAGSWRAATPPDMDLAAVRWLHGNGLQPAGRVEGDFAGSGSPSDAAYLLVDGEGRRRLVIIAGHQNRYDAIYPYLALVARIPKTAINSIQWAEREGPPEHIVGDGVLVVRGRDDASSGIVIFLTADGIASATPVNYQQISVQ